MCWPRFREDKADGLSFWDASLLKVVGLGMGRGEGFGG